MPLLPREALIGAGAHTLLIPMLIGAVVAAFVYLSRARAQADDADAISELEAGPVAYVRQTLAEASTGVRAARAELDQLSTFWRSTWQAGTPLPAVFASELAEVLGAAAMVLDTAASRLQIAANEASLPDLMPSAERLNYASHALGDTSDAVIEQIESHRDVGRVMRAAERDLQEADVAATEALRTVREVADPAGGFMRLAPVEYVAARVESFAHYGRWLTLGVLAAAVTILVIALVVLRPKPLAVIIPIALPLVMAAVILAWGWWSGEGPDARRAWLVAALSAISLTAVVGALSVLHWPYWLFAGGVTVLALWLTLGALARWNRPGALAWVVFAAIAFWSGTLGFLRERGGNPGMDLAVVARKSSATVVSGLYLGRTKDYVFLASSVDCRVSGCRRVLIVRNDDVACLAIGPRVDVSRPPPVEPYLGQFAASWTGRADKSDDCLPGVRSGFGGLLPGGGGGSGNRDAGGGGSGGGGSGGGNTGGRDGGGGGSGGGGSGQGGSGHGNTGGHDGSGGGTENGNSGERDGGGTLLGLFKSFSPRIAINLELAITPRATVPRRRLVRRLVLSSDVLFRFASSELTLAAGGRLRDLGATIRRWSPAAVWISGYTDATGGSGKNLRLSRARAYVVAGGLRRALTTDHIAVHALGFGETRPRVCERRPDGSADALARAYDRRVEISTRKPSASKVIRCPG